MHRVRFVQSGWPGLRFIERRANDDDGQPFTTDDLTHVNFGNVAHVAGAVTH